MAGKGKDEDDDEGNGGSGGGGSSTPAQAFPAFMPGQADMLAQQIGMGFGQDPAAVLATVEVASTGRARRRGRRRIICGSAGSLIPSLCEFSRRSRPEGSG